MWDSHITFFPCIQIIKYSFNCTDGGTWLCIAKYSNFSTQHHFRKATKWWLVEHIFKFTVWTQLYWTFDLRLVLLWTQECTSCVWILETLKRFLTARFSNFLYRISDTSKTNTSNHCTCFVTSHRKWLFLMSITCLFVFFTLFFFLNCFVLLSLIFLETECYHL